MTTGRTVRTPEKAADFLEAVIANGANVTEACKAVGIGRTTVYNWRDADPEFAEAFAIAIERGTDVLEDEVTRRAFAGTEEPVFYLGKECGRVRKYSDTLAIFILKARRPEKFKDRTAAEVSGPAGGPIMAETVVTFRLPENDR